MHHYYSFNIYLKGFIWLRSSFFPVFFVKDEGTMIRVAFNTLSSSKAKWWWCTPTPVINIWSLQLIDNAFVIHDHGRNVSRVILLHTTRNKKSQISTLFYSAGVLFGITCFKMINFLFSLLLFVLFSNAQNQNCGDFTTKDVEGPFFVEGVPLDLRTATDAEVRDPSLATILQGVVVDRNCRAVTGATVDVWYAGGGSGSGYSESVNYRYTYSYTWAVFRKRGILI